MKKSYIADNIMREYRKRKQYEDNKRWSEMQNYIKINCINCKNKSTDLCEIRRNIDGNLQCVNKKI
jgi:hypothetical protein